MPSGREIFLFIEGLSGVLEHEDPISSASAIEIGAKSNRPLRLSTPPRNPRDLSRSIPTPLFPQPRVFSYIESLWRTLRLPPVPARATRRRPASRRRPSRVFLASRGPRLSPTPRARSQMRSGSCPRRTPRFLSCSRRRRWTKPLWGSCRTSLPAHRSPRFSPLSRPSSALRQRHAQGVRLFAPS